MRGVDTNVLVRLIVRDDPKQVSRAEEFIVGGAWVSHVVLVETAWVLETVYERSPSQVRTAITLLLDHATLVIDQPDVVRAALDRFAARPKVGFSDHLVLELARRAGHLPLGTFHRGLGALDGSQRL